MCQCAQAVSMGLFSSAQLVRFLSLDVRPSVARAVSRSTSPEFSRAFIGRLMADPAFAQKLAIEQTITAGGSVFWEWRHRGENFTKELDFVAANTLTLMLANAAMIWSVSPTRSYGAANKLPWQSMLNGLPNNVFDASGPMRSYTNTSRAMGFFAKVTAASTSPPSLYMCKKMIMGATPSSCPLQIPSHEIFPLLCFLSVWLRDRAP